jgi:regulatory protein
MHVLRLEALPRQPNRVRVFLDGSPSSVVVSLLIATEAGLRPGLELDAGQLARILNRDTFQETLDRALHFLENRPRSEREIRTRLLRAGIAPELLDAVVERLEALGLVDDSAFARYWIENRERFSPRGARMIRAELHQKGLSSEVIAENLTDAIDETAGARSLALRQAPRWATLERKIFRQKMWAFLARKGFGYDVIQPVIDEAWTAVTGGAAGGDDDEAGPLDSISDG